MSGSEAKASQRVSGENPQSPVDARLTALIARTVAAEFHAIWVDPAGSADSFSFVHNDSFTPRDCTDVFLVDQHHRWSRGRGLPAEAYCRELRRRFEERLDEFEWELVAQEYQLRRDLEEASSPLLSDFIERFPDLGIRLDIEFGAASQDRTVTLDPTDSFDDGQAGTIADGLTRTFVAPARVESSNEASTIDLLDQDSNERIKESDRWSHSADSVLGQSRPFSKLPPALVQHIEDQLQTRRFGPRDFLMRQGEAGDGLFLIVKGQVEIRVTDAEGQTHLIADSGPGEILGEMALVTEEPRTADVIATEDVTAKFLPVELFDELAGRFPVISRVLTKLLADRLGTGGRDVLAGKLLSEYRVLNRLGKGGMAIVYQAAHEESGEVLALKMMSHRLVYDAQALELFQREAKVIESFDHPHIVKMKGRFRAFRSFFIVLEYCDGVSLDRTLRRHGPLPVPEFRKVIGQLASALAYAHEHNVVHRDVKPSNVMLTTCGDVKLMDFGLANPLDEAASTGVVVGTPRYMAPEQLCGAAIDARADLFALGCTAWKLLTGDDLITEENIVSIQNRHDNWQVPDVDCDDPAICEFIQKCLQHESADRNVDLNEIASWCE